MHVSSAAMQCAVRSLSAHLVRQGHVDEVKRLPVGTIGTVPLLRGCWAGHDDVRLWMAGRQETIDVGANKWEVIPEVYYNTGREQG